MSSKEFCPTSGQQTENKRKQKHEKILELSQTTEKINKQTTEYEGDLDTNFSWCIWNERSPKAL